MKKLTKEYSALLNAEYAIRRDRFWEDKDLSKIRIIHKFTGYVLAKPEFNIKSTLPKRKKIKYYIHNMDF
ncbi:hypothetical protein LCGC14_0456850 [marine sediment metagenome]|uniref:Uncharacterized protein n=1 Tax=marine sediment metagenome TaxID=412755 RepID=A0A0F9VQ63_9ZZZZ|nr:hypothetical protein [Candidatus Aminicenantes bacterium]